MKTVKFEGIIPALFTPFKANEEIDEDSLSSLINYLIESGVHGLWVMGTSSEFSSLSIGELKKSYGFIYEAVNNRVPCVAAVSSCSTKVSSGLAKYVEAIGYEAVAATPPYYLQSNARSLVEHYRAISESVKIPFAVYDNAAATHHAIPESLVKTMNQELGLNMMKVLQDPKKNPILKCRNLKKILPDDFNILIASAHFSYYAFTMGTADGTISALLNVIPETFVEMYEAIKSGDMKKAQELQYNKIIPLGFISFLLDNSENVAMAMGKTILKWRGVIESETVRKPLGPLNDWQINYLRSMAEHTGII